MAEETKPNPDSAKASTKTATAKAKKPPKLEDKPFKEFINQHFLPELKTALAEFEIDDLNLDFIEQPIPIPGIGETAFWQVIGKWNNGNRQFNLYFLEESITGKKAFSCATDGKQPSTLESFMIDERRITLDLLVLYTIQRLNSQKWLNNN